MNTTEELVGFAYYMATNYPEDVNPFTPQKFLKAKVNDLLWGELSSTRDQLKKKVAKRMAFGLSYHKIQLEWTLILDELNKGTQTNKKVISDLSKVAVDNRLNA